MTRQLDTETLGAHVEGRNLAPGDLRDQLGDEPTVMVFLRHFG